MLERTARGLRDWLRHRHLPWHLAVLAMLLCSPALGLGWQTDDHFHRVALSDGLERQGPSARAAVFRLADRSPADMFAFIAGDEETNRRFRSVGMLPWWSREGLKIAFYRPVTGLTHWVDYQIWPETPWLMHLHSLAWLGAVVVVAAFFYRRLLGAAAVAGLAAWLFAVDDAHGLPAVWLANRNATIAAFFGLVALSAHVRWRQNGWRPGAVIAPATLVLALLSNEGAVAIGGYLVAYAMFLDRGRWTARVVSLAPCAAAGLAWSVTYRAMGYGVAGCGVYVDPMADPVRFLGALVERAPTLLLGQWALPSDLQWVMSQNAKDVMWLVAVSLLAVGAAAFVPLLRRDRKARFWATGMVLSVVPACSTFPSDRLLFLAGLGGMGLAAQFVTAVLNKAEWLPRGFTWRLPLVALCAVLVFIHLVVAPLSLTQAAGNVERFDAVAARAAASLPSDGAVEEQTFLIVSTPTYYVPAIALLIRAFEDRAFPARTFVLGSGIHSMEIHRPDERTLLLRPRGGFLAAPGSPEPGREAEQPLVDTRHGFPLLDRLYRDDLPMRAGRRIELAALTVEITAITKDGRPAEAAFRFPAPLEAPSLRWVRWENGAYVPFVLPAVGETVTLPALNVPF